MDFDVKRTVMSDELLPDEKILWHGNSCLSKIFTKIDIFLVPFSILWGGFVVFWSIGATRVGGAFGLFGIPFVVMGMYFIFGRFVVKNAVKKSTIYAITNQRIIIVRTNSDGTKKSVCSSEIKSISSESASYDKNGIGTIIFGAAPYWRVMYLNTGLDSFMGSPQDGVMAFFDIEDCENVMRTYRDLKHRSLPL